MSTRLYDIHSLVGVEARVSDAVLHEIDLHLAPFRSSVPGGQSRVRIRPFSELEVRDTEVRIDTLEFGQWSMVNRPAKSAIVLGEGVHTYYCDNALPIPVNLMVELALLPQRATFVHAASFEIEGRGVLLPAYPGTGKTTTAAAIVQQGGKFLGDDLCIVADDLLSYPQALSVYPHHLPILHYDDANLERAFRRGELADNVGSKLFTGTARPARVGRRALAEVGTRCANVMPEAVFGKQAIGDVAKPALVASLARRVGLTELAFEECEPVTLAAHAAMVLWHEWHGSLHQLMLLDAVNAGGTWIETLLTQTRDILQERLAGCRCVQISIPADWDNQTLCSTFPDFLRGLL